jgi:hypothetical protein
MVDATLEHTTTVTMSCHFDTVGGDCIVNELHATVSDRNIGYNLSVYLVVLGCQFVEALLNHMVTVQVLNEDNHVKAESNDDRVDLTPSRKEVNHLLNRTCTMHIERDVDEVLGNRFADEIALFIRGELQQLLAEVVTEGVCHQVREMTEGFTEDHIAMLGGTLLELLLEVSAAVLVLAQRGDLPHQILDVSACEAVV